MKDAIVYYYYADSYGSIIKCDPITAHCIRNQGWLNNQELIPVLHHRLHCVLHHRLHCILHHRLHCVLHHRLYCVLHHRLHCVLHHRLHCVLHHRLDCVLHHRLHCVLHHRLHYVQFIIVYLSVQPEMMQTCSCHSVRELILFDYDGDLLHDMNIRRLGSS